VSQSAAMLVEILTPIMNYSRVIQLGAQDEQAQPAVQDERFNMPIEELDLSVRTLNALRRADITTLGELLNKEERDLLSLRNFGQKSNQEIIDKLESMGLSLVRKETDNEDSEVSEDSEEEELE
jgi:DNA-directed RNA polymerase subunit alpha